MDFTWLRPCVIHNIVGDIGGYLLVQVGQMKYSSG